MLMWTRRANIPATGHSVHNDHPMAFYGKRGSREAPGVARAPMSATRRMLQARVTYEQHDKAHVMAEALGISVSALLAELVDRAEVDEHGQPTWTSRYARPQRETTDDTMRLSA
jgi:hypothetical protein